MRRQVMVAFAILGLAACGQRQNQAAPSASSAGTTGAATEAAKPDVGAAAQPDAGAAANPDAASCLDLVANEMYADAVPACDRALRADATNEKVKSALATAQAKIVEIANKAASGAGEAAQGAADAAKDSGAAAAEDAAKGAAGSVPAPPKTY